mgnify:CR=1 FL=1
MEYSLTQPAPESKMCQCGHHAEIHETAEYRVSKSRWCLAVKDGRSCPCRHFAPAPLVRQFPSLDDMVDFIRRHGELDGWTIRVHHL